MLTRPRVVIATTTWWPSAARLLVALRRHGAVVTAICPSGHPLRVLCDRDAVRSYSPFRPLASLERVLRTQQPDLVVPTDDRAVGHLHAIHARTPVVRNDDRRLRALIERSLGAPDGYATTGTRDRLLRAVRARGVRVPPGQALGSLAELRDWLVRHPGRCVVKAEGSWGGSGVVIADTPADAEAAFEALSRPLALRRIVRLLVLDRDLYVLPLFRARRRPPLTVQRFIDGHQANIMVSCRDGLVLDSLSVRVLRAQHDTGAATVVRLVDDAGMAEVAAVVAAELGASGFFGLDFIVEAHTGALHLIEMNPRATQIGHMRRHGRDLAGSLLEGIGVATNRPAGRDGVQTMALFPQALRFDGEWLLENRTETDAPFEEPALVAELLRRPWTRRGLLARLESRLRNRRQGFDLDPHEAGRLLDVLRERSEVPVGARS